MLSSNNHNERLYPLEGLIGLFENCIQLEKLYLKMSLLTDTKQHFKIGRSGSLADTTFHYHSLLVMTSIVYSVNKSRFQFTLYLLIGLL